MYKIVHESNPKVHSYSIINTAPADENEAAQMTNWICFGTKSKDECTNAETGIDKYMYRIIGVTEEGQMYLIKETFLKEGETYIFECDNVNIKM